jgi:ATP-dependent Zn protease
MSPAPHDIATAYHEAGHAVLAMALGRAVQRVSIEPNQLRLGMCELKKGKARGSEDAVETEILYLLGGLAAEARHTGEYCHEGAAQDLRMVRSLTRMRAASDKQIERLERRMLDKTEHLLNQRSNWLAVTLIAAELLRTPTISGRAARHFFEQAARQAEKEE